MEGFEGPEKRLELRFAPSRCEPRGLRTLTRAQLDELCDLVNCAILSCISNQELDAYVLSESSLFVYSNKLVMKTCGTTTLLRALPKLMEHARNLDLTPNYVCYSRRNFFYPHRQQHPHCSFENEVEILNDRFDGHAFIVGPLTGAHWHMYVADSRDHESMSEEELSSQTFEIMMTRLDQSKMQTFVRKSYPTLDPKGPNSTAKEITSVSGLADMFPGAVTDEFLFDPCGYSMNGIKKEAFATTHVTPEPECSFVSYEITASTPSYNSMLEQAVSAFGPGELTVTLFTDKYAECGSSRAALQGKLKGYKLIYKSTYEFDGELSVTVMNFARPRAINVPIA